MPKVGKKKFPYTPAGKTAAANYKKSLVAASTKARAAAKAKKTRNA